MDNSEDIWEGGSIKKGVYDPNYTPLNSYETNDDTDWYMYGGIAFGVIVLVVFLLFMSSAPSMFHHKLVVCSNNHCTEYTDWKVINENRHNGILEVYAGGRLQRLSNGTWHYE